MRVLLGMAVLLCACGGAPDPADVLGTGTSDDGPETKADPAEPLVDYSGTYTAYGQLVRDECPLSVDPATHLPIATTWAIVRDGNGFRIRADGFPDITAGTSSSQLTADQVLQGACGPVRFRFGVKPDFGGLSGQFWADFQNPVCAGGDPCSFQGVLELAEP